MHNHHTNQHSMTVNYIYFDYDFLRNLLKDMIFMNNLNLNWSTRLTYRQQLKLRNAILSGQTLKQIQATEPVIDKLTYLECKANLFEQVKVSHNLLLQAIEDLNAPMQDAFNNALEKVVADHLDDDCYRQIEAKTAEVITLNVA